MVAVGDWKVAVIFSQDLIPMSMDAPPPGLPAGEMLASKGLERIYICFSSGITVQMPFLLKRNGLKRGENE